MIDSTVFFFSKDDDDYSLGFERSEKEGREELFNVVHMKS